MLGGDDQGIRADREKPLILTKRGRWSVQAAFPRWSVGTINDQTTRRVFWTARFSWQVGVVMFLVNINPDDVNQINTRRQVPLAVSRNFLAPKLPRNHTTTCYA